MKKFFLSTIAVLALVGCSKIETPVVNFANNTKAEINFSSQATAGTKAVVETTTLTEEQTFSVFADVNEGSNHYQYNYLNAAEYNGKGNPTNSKHYYWPELTGAVTLDFFAIYPADTYVRDTTKTKPTVTVNVNCEKVNDDCVDIMFACNKGQSFDEGKTVEENRKKLNFKHQLSLIEFRARMDDAATPVIFEKVTVKKIEVVVPTTTGTIAFVDTADVNCPFSAAATPKTADFKYNPVESDITVTAVKATDDWTECGKFLAVPQNIEDITDAYAVITYSYQLKGNTSKTYTKTTKPLSLKSKDDTKWTDWAKGTRYIYNITIGLKEILFTVSVDEWKVGGNKEIY